MRLHVDVEGLDGTEAHEVPYLAMRWQWKTIMAYPWKQPAHINELELNAVAVFLKRRTRSHRGFSKKFFHVLDSMVSRGALAKGRSTRLNKVVRKCGAHLIATDNYMFPVWTISRWNFADKPSRLHEKATA